MSIFNNQQIQLNNRNGVYSAIGNNNVFRINRVQLNFSIVGNNNLVEVTDSQIRVAITGNNNTLKCQNSQVNYTVTGNNNTATQNNGGFVVNNVIGNGNVQPGQQNNQRPAFQQRQRGQNRNMGQYNMGGMGGNFGGFNGNMSQMVNLINAYSNLNNFPNHPNRNFRNYVQHHHHEQQQQQQDFIEQEEKEQQRLGLSEDEINMLPRSKNNGKVGSCSVCLDQVKIGHKQIFLFCFHRFHQLCIQQWLKKSKNCPVCQLDVRHHLRS